ncbi:MAG: class I SAM-dependent methyltransferase [Rhodothermia bacterium]|nr:class I SAM-dependent methyltransferase [Rhodothermia bacterium]
MRMIKVSMKGGSGTLAILLICTGWIGCRGAEDAPASHYRELEPSDSLGTGRYYLGREIARIRSHREIASWLDRPERELAEFPERLVKALDLKPSDVVADIGAGTGFYTFRIADMVPHGRVLAVDIQPEMLVDLRARAEAQGYDNVEVIQGEADDPNLPAASVDLVLIVGSYHEFSYPYEMMRQIEAALVPGGRVALAEYRGEDETLPLSTLHRLTEAQARKEMEYVGLGWTKTLDILPRQHLMFFEKPFGTASNEG